MTTPTLPGPMLRRWTKAEYHQMHDLGLFNDQCVELIDGEVIIMPNPGHLHCLATELAVEALRTVFGPGHWYRVQMPVDVHPASEPMPDVAVAPGAPRSHTGTPTTALVVVEVSDTTLAHDRRKSHLYAAAGLADFWIINLGDRRLEVYRRPVADLSADFGSRYADVTFLVAGDFVTPLAAPQARIAVADLLP